MIKGCSRKVIVIKNPESELFEEAYFIVNPKKSERKQNDLLAEANRIISARATSTDRVGGKARMLIVWIIGFVCGICAAVPIIHLLP